MRLLGVPHEPRRRLFLSAASPLGLFMASKKWGNSRALRLPRPRSMWRRRGVGSRRRRFQPQRVQRSWRGRSGRRVRLGGSGHEVRGAGKVAFPGGRDERDGLLVLCRRVDHVVPIAAADSSSTTSTSAPGVVMMKPLPTLFFPVRAFGLAVRVGIEGLDAAGHDVEEPGVDIRDRRVARSALDW